MSNLPSALVFCALAGLAQPLFAQRQFAESGKTYLPFEREASRAVVAADFDGDGDRDLLVGNNEVVAGAQNRLLLNDGHAVFTDVTGSHLPPGLWSTDGIAVGDVDQDGDLDFATGDSWQNRLFLNDGQARFTDATFGRMPPQTSETRRLRFADVDGDGDLDLVCANYGQETLSLNDGTGRFTDVTATHLPVDAESTWELAVTDIDGDGDADLAFAGQSLPHLYRNDGSGHFSDATASHLPPSAPSAGATVTFADVDADGDRDLFVGLWSTQPRLFLNDGTGHFQDATAGRVPTSATYEYHWREAFGDIDGDGDLDIAYSTIYEDRLLLNDGTGHFTDGSATRLPRILGATIDIGLADLDGDNDLDLFTAEVSQQNRLLFNDGAGFFANATPEHLETPWVPTPALTLGDLDGDGDLDLVVASGDYGESIGEDTLLLNDGRGDFLPAPAGSFPAVLDDSRAVVLGDVDGDGDLDIVLGNAGAQSRLFLNGGAANFSDATTTHLPAASPRTTSLALADVDGDGDRDLVLGNFGERCCLYTNDGTGHFTDATASHMPNLAFETRAIVCGDLDGDGDRDLVLGNGLFQPEQERVYRNDGTGHFTDVTAAQINEPYVLPTASLQLGDLDMDGDLDVMVGNGGVGLGRFNRMLENDGTGHFTGRDLVYDYYNTLALALADVDLDGDLDVFCGDFDHYDKLYLNTGAGVFANVTWPRMPATPDMTSSLAVGDVDGDGDPDLVRGSEWNIATVLVNHHRQLAAPRLPKLGTAWTLQVSAQPGYATAPQFAIPFVGTAPAAIPVPPLGTLGVDPQGLLVLPMLLLPAPTGTASVQLALPNAPAFAGMELFSQALVLHTTSLASARFTNLLRERLVR